MRDDMDKLLVTRPRIGHKMKNQEVKEARNSKDFDKLPSFSSMKPKSRNGERKQFSEYFAPLKRYLIKNCKRPWDKIYSEICQKMDKDSVVKAHIFLHLEDFVETNPVFINGIPHRNYRFGGIGPLYHDGWSFYVDQNGLLQIPPSRPKSESKNNKNLFIKDSCYYIKREQDNIWFEMLTLKNPSWDDCTGYKPPEEWILQIFGEWKLRNTWIRLRTLTKKEKKALKLS